MICRDRLGGWSTSWITLDIAEQKEAAAIFDRERFTRRLPHRRGIVPGLSSDLT